MHARHNMKLFEVLSDPTRLVFVAKVTNKTDSK
jgi:hypothetical protein